MILETSTEKTNFASPISSKLIIVEIEIEFKVPKTIAAMIDTGASYTHIKGALVPADGRIDLNRKIQTVGFNGSITHFTQKVKPTMIRIGSLKINTPHTLMVPRDLPTTYDMILGMNFIQSIHGGISVMPSGLMNHKQIVTVPLINPYITSECAGNHGGHITQQRKIALFGKKMHHFS